MMGVKKNFKNSYQSARICAHSRIHDHECVCAHIHTHTDTQAKCGYNAYVNYLDSTIHGATYICVKTSC